MNTLESRVQETLLAPSGLMLYQVEQALSSLDHVGADFGDFYFQHAQKESWSLEDGIVKSGSYSIDAGVGVRVISGEKTGFAYADSIDLEALNRSAQAAKGIAKAGQSRSMKVMTPNQRASFYTDVNPVSEIGNQQKVDLLKQIDARARAFDTKIIEVMADLSASFEHVLVMATDGTLAYDIRPMVRLNVTVVAESGTHRESGFAGGGGRHEIARFWDERLWEQFTDEACRVALTNLEAVPAPAGAMDVVLGNGWPGVLLHEAFGHGLEGDFNRKGTSTFSKLMGKKVASDCCTVVDNGTLEHRRGSLNLDDEGTPTQNTVLVENGVLKNYMQDKHNAHLMGTKSTGNGRRESYAHLTLPRMTNTYMLPGQHTPEEIIASVKKGIYAKNFSGGAVDITSGKFVFVANEAYLIENGKIKQPVKGATLIGDGPSALLNVSMVGNDLELDTGVGVCGKDGQSVPVGVGQPTLRVDGLTVGGTDES